MLVFVLAFPPLLNSNQVVSVSIDFLANSKQDPCFIILLITILVLIGTVFVIILRDVQREDVFKLSASAVASEFCK